MQVFWFIVGVLAVWRVTHLFVAEDGPWHLLARLRRRAGEGLFADLLDCFYCASLWVAAPVAFLLAATWDERLLLWLGLSGGAILIERATAYADSAPLAIYHEDPEDDHGMLRKTKDGQSDGE